jgi:trehalose 6-phosphate synthase
LSEFAGAAEYLKDAFLVNPYDIDGMSRVLEHAFDSELRDRRARMRSMRKEVERLDVHRWADSFLGELEHNVQE